MVVERMKHVPPIVVSATDMCWRYLLGGRYAHSSNYHVCIVSGQLFGVPNAVIYMTKSTLQRWRRIRDFGHATLDNVVSVLYGLAEPAEFVAALRNSPPVSEGTQLYSVAMSPPAEKLTFSISLYRTLSHTNIGEMIYARGFSDLSRIIN